MRLFTKIFTLMVLCVVLVPFQAFAKKSDEYSLVVNSNVNDSTLTIEANIEGATTGNGHWKLIPTGKGSGGKASLPVKDMTSTSVSFKHSYSSLAPGEYCFNLKYEGKLDGSKASYPFLKKFCVTVAGEQKPVTDDKTQPTNPDKELVSDNETPDQKVEQVDAVKSPNGNGGEMPNTATTYPTGLLAGVILALFGMTWLVVRGKKASL